MKALLMYSEFPGCPFRSFTYALKFINASSHIKTMEDCKTKLTPEQRKKLREMIEDGPMMEGMGMKHDHERGMKKK